MPSSLLAANDAQANSRQERSDSPDTSIRDRATGLDTTNRQAARQVGADRCRHNSQSSTANKNLCLGGVAPDIPPNSLLEGGIGGDKLADLVVVLGLAGRRKRREEERARNNTKGRSDRQHRNRASAVGELDGRDARKAHDKDAGKVEAQRKRDGDAVDGDGKGRGMKLRHKRQQLAVVEAAGGLGVHVGERAEQMEGDGGGKDVNG